MRHLLPNPTNAEFHACSGKKIMDTDIGEVLR
jgi:hypothetical protein